MEAAAVKVRNEATSRAEMPSASACASELHTSTFSLVKYLAASTAGWSKASSRHVREKGTHASSWGSPSCSAEASGNPSCSAKASNADPSPSSPSMPEEVGDEGDGKPSRAAAQASGASPSAIASGASPSAIASGGSPSRPSRAANHPSEAMVL